MTATMMLPATTWGEIPSIIAFHMVPSFQVWDSGIIIVLHQVDEYDQDHRCSELTSDINRATKENPMLTRRHLLHTSLFTGCAVCAALATSRLSTADAMQVVAPSKISGAGYELSSIGSQRQTILTGDRAAPSRSTDAQR